jgi:formylglycine-generating enzyme required for sulfatase activity
MEQKTVFISYRRALSKHLARSIYMDLKMNGWDVFLDVNTIDSGDLDHIILNQIRARAHFILVISPGSLERCTNSGDWVLREIQEAVRVERNIVPIVEEGADFSREMGYLPSDVRAIVSKKNALPLPHFFFDAAVDMLQARFLKTPEYIKITAPPTAERAEVQRRMAAAEFESPARVTKPRSTDLLPAPFDWVAIPNRNYSIAKYPVTNAQFVKFIEADGYSTQRWWTAAGWKRQQKEKWIEPLNWSENWRNQGSEQPIVGVSWYEAVAYCLWLSQATGENIMLPTENQWQYAAQGDDRRHYPWGNDWNGARCNNNVDGTRFVSITHVRTYEGMGDSPFGVVDMAGNVKEWCLTDYDAKTNDIDASAKRRALRGGSHKDKFREYFCCSYRDFSLPHYRGHKGFRLTLK